VKQTTDEADEQLWQCVNDSWNKLDNYYRLTDSSHQIYAAATFLNPIKRLAHFEKQWTGKLGPWIQVMEDNCRDWWTQEYLSKKTAEPEDKMSAFESYLLGRNTSGPTKKKDEFSSYGRATPKEVSTLKNFNPIEWWDDNKTVYQTLYLWALDTLSIPAMATECERAFSSAKKLITPERNALADTTIEATECLKAWWDQGLIHRD
jgi:hAT family C-terminal dimerisation region